MLVAVEPSQDAHLPEDYPSIVGLFEVHAINPEARAGLLLYVNRLLAAGKSPDDVSRQRIIVEADRTIESIKADPDLFAGHDRQAVLGQLASVRRALSGDENPTKDAIKPRQIASPLPGANRHPVLKLDVVADRAIVVELVSRLATDAATGGERLVDEWVAVPAGATPEQIDKARKHVEQLRPIIPFIVAGMAAQGGGFGSMANRVAIAAPASLGLPVRLIYLKGQSIFANKATNDFGEIPCHLSLGELKIIFPPASPEDIIHVRTEMGRAGIDGDLAKAAAEAISAQQLRRLGTCVLLPVVAASRLIIFDSLMQYRLVGVVELYANP